MALPTDTTFLPTASLGFPGSSGGDLPPLAQYRPRSQYVPQYGDYVVWSKWFTCWHGVVKFFDDRSDELHIIFAGVPFLLFTMTEAEQEKDTTKIKLSELRGAKNGKFAILQHDHQANANIWYI